jgi:hypothetical protein
MAQCEFRADNAHRSKSTAIPSRNLQKPSRFTNQPARPNRLNPNFVRAVCNNCVQAVGLSRSDDLPDDGVTHHAKVVESLACPTQGMKAPMTMTTPSGRTLARFPRSEGSEAFRDSKKRKPSKSQDAGDNCDSQRKKPQGDFRDTSTRDRTLAHLR